MSALDVANNARQIPVDSIDAILDGQLYISSLACATTLNKVHPELQITHVLSICTDLVSRGPTHMVIPILDSEYGNILEHLPAACNFIGQALSTGGKVLVHCVMGVSRSATVVAAYLMKTRHLSPSQALEFVRSRRPRIFPNYGFVKQLHVFEACSYAPSPAHPAYRSWKRRQQQDVTQFLNVLSDTAVICRGIYLNTDLPNDRDQTSCLVKYMGLSHCLSLSPSDIRPHSLGIDQRHIDMSSDSAGLILALPSACDYIRSALASDGRVLVHSKTESVAVLVTAAYLMRSQNLPPNHAIQKIKSALPLFEPTANFMRHLETFAICDYASVEQTIEVPTPHLPTQASLLVGAAKDRPARTLAPPARPLSILGRG